jgi:hypothetical protein
MSDTTISQTTIVSALNTTEPSVITEESVYAHLDRMAGHRVMKTNTCNGNGAQTDAIFTVVGKVEIFRIYGVCTEATNATTFSTAYFDLYDGAAALEITDNAGTDLSGIGVGGFVVKDAVATTALTFNNNVAGTFTDGGGAGYFTTMCPFRVGKKIAQTTSIRFCFTGDANTDVDMKFYVDFFPLSDDGDVNAV